MDRTSFALDQQAEMLAVARDKGVEAVDEALEQIAEQLAISLANNPYITPARRDEAFDELPNLRR